MKLWHAALILGSVIFVSLAAVACGGSKTNSGNAARASATVASSPASVAASPASTPGVAASTSGATTSGTALTETTTDNKYSQAMYTIQAGQSYTITVVNKGQAIHNWHVVGVNSTDGKPIMAPLTDAGKSSTITFTIAKPGTYHFHCDVHPTEMTGTLIVQ